MLEANLDADSGPLIPNRTISDETSLISTLLRSTYILKRLAIGSISDFGSCKCTWSAWANARNNASKRPFGLQYPV